MRKAIILGLVFFSINITNLLAFELKNYLIDYLKKEFGFDEVFIDEIRISKEINGAPDNINIEKIYGKYLKFSLISDNSFVEGKAEIRAFRKVLTAKTTLEKGKEVSEDDISESLVDYSKVPKGAIIDPNQVIGKTLKSSISAGSVFVESKLITIKKGQTVIIKVDNPYFKIKMEGKALEDGYNGKLIRILNTTTNKVVKGVIQDDKTIIVYF